MHVTAQSSICLQRNHFFLPAPTPPFLPVFAALAPGLPFVGGSFRLVPGSAGLIVKNESRRPVKYTRQQRE